jgi:hypothetical protein
LGRFSIRSTSGNPYRSYTTALIRVSPTLWWEASLDPGRAGRRPHVFCITPGHSHRTPGDFDAVKAGLTLEWSSGKVEGNITRVKMIKRQMYGRAKLDLLRKRILAPP